MPNFIMTPLISFFGALTGSSVAATVLAHITVAGVSMVGANLLMPKVDFGQAQTRQSLNVRGRNQRNATTNRQYIYGQVKVGGTVAYMGVTDTDNKFLHMVLVHCDHEVEELGDLYVNGELIPMASGGEGVLRTTDTSSTFGTSLADRYNGSLYIADHLGGPSQTTADSTLNNATGDINSSDAFKGMAYTYIRMELKQGEENAFPSGIPQFQRVIKGMKVYDPRESSHDPDDSTTWEYSSNWALCVAHFLQSDFGYGRYGLTYDNINETELIASANDSGTTIDEFYTAWSANEEVPREYLERVQSGWVLQAMTLGTTGSSAPDLTGLSQYEEVSDGTVTWRLARQSTNSANRYELNGMVDSHEDPIEVLRKMKTAASGMIEYIGGEWFVRSGRYIAPTVTLSESDFVTGISGTTKDDRTNAVNTVKGVIVDKHDFYNVIDAPSVTNSTFVTEDGGVESVKEMELLFTNSHKTAQRLFKIDLNKSRQSISHKASFTSKAMQLQVGDNFYLNFAKYGYSNKLFQVWSHQLVINEGALQVEMEFRETATNVYDWDHTTDETALDPAPNTTLPDPFSVPTGPTPTITSGTATLVQTADGTINPTMHVDWTPVADANVIAYELRWERFLGQYEYMTINGRDSSTAVIGGVIEGSTYGVQIRCITPLKIGAWGTNVDHDVVGKSAAPTAPTGFTATAIVEGVKLSMSEHPDVDFKQFLIYQNTNNSKPGSHSYVTTDTTKTITGLTAGQQYFFWLEAEDTTAHTTAAASSVNATPEAVAAADVSGLGDLATQNTVAYDTDVTGTPTQLSDINTTEGTKLTGVEDNATAGATWGTNISNEPTDLSGINSTEGTKLTGIADNADVTQDAVEGNISVATGGIDMSGTSAISANFVSGVSGFQIKGNGDAEFNDITVRGDAVLGTSNTLVVLDDVVTSTSSSHTEWEGADGSVARGIFTQHDDDTPTGYGSMVVKNSSAAAFNKFVWDLARGTDFDNLTTSGFSQLVGQFETNVYNGGGTTPWSSGPYFAASTDPTTSNASNVDGTWQFYASPKSGAGSFGLNDDLFYTNNVEHSFGGPVGIGISTPSDELHVVGVAKITAAVLTPLLKSGNGASSVTLQGGNSGGGSIDLYGESHSGAANDAFINANTLTIRNAGKTTDIAEFDSSEVDIKTRLKVDLPSNAWSTSTSWYSVSDGGSDEYGSLNTGGSYAVTLNGNGYRRSGVAASVAWVSHEASPSNYTGATQIWQYPAGYMTFNANSSWPTGSNSHVTERMRVHGNGDVSIGTTSSGYKLRVNGSARIEDSLTLGDVGSEGGELVILDHNNSNTNRLRIDVDSAGNSRMFNDGNGDLMLGNLVGGNGATRIYANADNKAIFGLTQTEFTDEVRISGATSGRGLLVDNDADINGALEIGLDLDVIGTKNFRIAHPVRDGYDLRHTCVESPQADLTYRGQATLVDGTVQIDLDSEFGMTAGTFAALNDDVQVFAQNESGWDAVRGSVSEGVLTIDCQNLESTDSVGWLVIGRRTGVELEIEPETKIK